VTKPTKNRHASSRRGSTQQPRLVRFPQGGHENLDNYGTIEVMRHFLYD
jgi:hypothetical protein